MTGIDEGTQEKLRNYASPRWGYQLGAEGEVVKQLFDGVLPDGWADSPAYATKPGRAPKRKPAAAAGGAKADDEPLSPPYDQYGFRDLRDEYRHRTGKGVKVGTDTETLIALLEDLDAGENPNEG